jgi:hypothetical protein
VERLEPLERTDPPDERNEAVEPFDCAQGKLFKPTIPVMSEPLERLEAMSIGS